MVTVAEPRNRGHVALAWCLSVLFVVCLAGCGKKEVGGQEPNKPAGDVNEPAPTTAVELETPPAVESPVATPAPAPVAAPDPDATVVTVNGEAITERQVSAATDFQVRLAGAQLANMPAALVDGFKERIRPRVVENLIAETLLDQRIEAANIVVTEEQVVATIEAEGAKRTPPITIETFKQMVESQDGNFQDVLDEYRTRMARQQYLESQWAGKADVNDAEVQAYYDAHPTDFDEPERVRASHILIKPGAPDPNDPEAAKAGAKAKAETLLAELKDGADFAELAQANSDCPSKAQGGDLGLHDRSVTWVDPFKEAAFALQAGQISDVVETQFGYHIIKVTEHPEAHTKTLAEARDEIVAKLTGEKRSQLASDLLTSMRDGATIVYAPGSEPAAAAPVLRGPPAASGQN